LAINDFITKKIHNTGTLATGLPSIKENN